MTGHYHDGDRGLTTRALRGTLILVAAQGRDEYQLGSRPPREPLAKKCGTTQVWLLGLKDWMRWIGTLQMPHLVAVFTVFTPIQPSSLLTFRGRYFIDSRLRTAVSC